MKSTYQNSTISALTKNNLTRPQQQLAAASTSFQSAHKQHQQQLFTQQSSTSEKGVTSKITKLSNQIKELQSGLNSEDQALENMEKLTQKTHSVLSSQIGSLRKAFNMLADVVMEEIETVKVDMFLSLEERTQVVERKIQERDNYEDVINRIIEGKINERMERVEGNYRQQVVNMERLTVQVREENQIFLEKVKGLVGNNASRIDVVLKERVIQSRDIEELNRQILNLQRKNQDLQVAELENKERIDELMENKINVSQMIEQLDEQIENVIVRQKDKEQQNDQEIDDFRKELDGQLAEILRKQSDIQQQQQQQLQLQQQGKNGNIQGYEQQDDIRRLDQQVRNTQKDMENGFKELALIYKQSAKQIIADFDESLKQLRNNCEYAQMRVADIENITKKCSNDIVQLQNAFTRQLDQIQYLRSN